MPQGWMSCHGADLFTPDPKGDRLTGMLPGYGHHVRSVLLAVEASIGLGPERQIQIAGVRMKNKC